MHVVFDRAHALRKVRHLAYAVWESTSEPWWRIGRNHTVDCCIVIYRARNNNYNRRSSTPLRPAASASPPPAYGSQPHHARKVSPPARKSQPTRGRLCACVYARAHLCVCVCARLIVCLCTPCVLVCVQAFVRASHARTCGPTKVGSRRLSAEVASPDGPSIASRPFSSAMCRGWNLTEAYHVARGG